MYGPSLKASSHSVLAKFTLFEKRKIQPTNQWRLHAKFWQSPRLVSRQVGAKVTFYNTMKTAFTYKNRGLRQKLLIATLLSRRLCQSAS